MKLLDEFENIFTDEELDYLFDYDLYDSIVNAEPYTLPEELTKQQKKAIHNSVKGMKSKYVKNLVDEYLRTDTQPEPENLRAFLEQFLPKIKSKFNIFVALKNGNYTNIKANRTEHIDQLCRLVNCPHFSVYHYHTPFRYGKVCDAKSVGFNAITIDVDDVLFPFDMETATQEEIRQFLLDSFDFTDKPFPDAVSLSSKKGMHMIYFHDYVDYADKERNKLRQHLFDSMLLTFGGDKLTKNPCHMFRTPLSFHLKREPVRGRLFLFDNSGMKNLDRLMPFMQPQEDIDAYFAKCKEITEEKKAKTRHENQILKLMQEKGCTREQAEEFLTQKEAKKQKKNRSKKKESPSIPLQNPTEPAETDEDVDDDYDYDFDFSHLTYRKSHSNKPIPILLTDLHNYLVRNGSKCLYHKRHLFFFILSNYAKQVIPDADDFIKYCEQYCPRSSMFFPELEDIVRSNYGKERFYKFRYEKIAKLLCFSEQDMKESRSCFDPQLKAEKRKQYNHEYYERTKTKELPQSKQLKVDCLEYLLANPDATETDIRIIFDISRATFYRYRKELNI